MDYKGLKRRGVRLVEPRGRGDHGSRMVGDVLGVFVSACGTEHYANDEVPKASISSKIWGSRDRGGLVLIRWRKWGRVQCVTVQFPGGIILAETKALWSKVERCVWRGLASQDVAA